jgi:hypothetical protein
VGAASATSEAENVQAEEEGVLEQVGESRGGNIKADPLRIILFQVTKPYFCWEFIAATPAFVSNFVFAASA